MMTDPIADMLTQIRNAGMARHERLEFPASKLKRAILDVLEQEGYVSDVSIVEGGGHPKLSLTIRYNEEGTTLIEGIRRVSRPGRRVYVSADAIPKVRNGVGRAVISTSRGVMSDMRARELAIGGEVLCEVW